MTLAHFLEVVWDDEDRDRAKDKLKMSEIPLKELQINEIENVSRSKKTRYLQKSICPILEIRILNVELKHIHDHISTFYK